MTTNIAFLAALGLMAASMTGACFNPDYPQNLPCDQSFDNWCPDGLVCNAQLLCVAGASDGGAASSDAMTDPGLGQLVSVSIGEDITLEVGATHAFEITANYENGSQVVDTNLAIWRSTDNAVVWLDFTGLATAEAEGMAMVTVRYEGLVGATQVTVVPAP